MSRLTAVALAVLLTAATVSVAVLGGAAVATEPSQHASSETTAASETAADSETTADSESYAGTYVAFETSGDALTGYAVDGDEQFENVSVQSQSDYRTEADLDADVGVSAVTDVSGVGVDLESESETRAEIATEGSATMTAHDTERGILTVDAGEEDQYVEVALADESDAEADGDVVVVESENRTGAFVVVGDGAVAVNDDGNVTADLASESTLVFRSYGDGERDDDAEHQEQLIAEGTATAEVYADERDGERVADVATYGEDVAVETAAEGEERFEMAVERAHGEGTIVITTVTEAALEAAGTAEDLAVTVDGEAAAEASSKSELEGAIGGEESAFMVHQTSETSADVLVAVNHFSEREVAIQEADGDDADESDADGSADDQSGADDAGGESDDSGADDAEAADDGDDAGEKTDLDTDTVPGFGSFAAMVSLLSAVALRVRR